jgi:hypothetical protein
LSQLCFIVPTFKYPLYISDDTHFRLFFIIERLTTTTMLWSLFLSFLFIIKTSSLIDLNGKSINNRLS